MSRPRSEAEAVAALQYATKAAGSAAAWCTEKNVSESQVSATLKGRMVMPPKVAAALGLTPVRMYITTPTTTTPRPGGRKV